MERPRHSRRDDLTHAPHKSRRAEAARGARRGVPPLAPNDRTSYIPPAGLEPTISCLKGVGAGQRLQVRSGRVPRNDGFCDLAGVVTALDTRISEAHDSIGLPARNDRGSAHSSVSGTGGGADG
jgi:hypothetical protein